MWRVLVFGFLGAVVAILLSLVPSSVRASEPSWLTSPVLRLAEAQLRTVKEASKACGSKVSIITVTTASNYKEACVYGVTDGVRLARYQAENTSYRYAVAFPTDSTFRPIDNLCEGLEWCGYAHASDMLLLQVPDSGGAHKLSMISNFSSRIKREGAHFKYVHTGPHTFIRVEQQEVPTLAYSVSPNGKWGVVSSLQFGLLRIHFGTQKVNKIDGASSLSLTHSHLPELTISDDGVWTAMTGENVETRIWQIKDDCPASGCGSTKIAMDTLSHGFTSAHNPRFSSDGQRLQISVKARSKFFTITLASKPHGTGNPYYLALGDSFTSGEGETSDNFYINATNSQSNRCHVSSRSYPYILGNHWDVVTNNIACSGSRITDVRAASKKYIANPGVQWPSMISLGVGGNDVDLMGKLKQCIGLDTCEWAKGNRMLTRDEIKELFPKMVTFLQELQVNLSPGLLFLVGYPSVINDAHEASCSLLINSMLNAQERAYMNQTIHYLNKVLQAAALYVRVPFADIEDAYNGERLCDNKEAAMNGIRFGDDIAPLSFVDKVKVIGAESFHPTPRGHTLSADRIYMQHESLNWIQWGCAGCEFSPDSLESATYWTEGSNTGQSVIRQLASRFLESEYIKNILNIAFNFPPNTFSPNSLVRFELHSEVQQLGVYTAEPDGSLTSSLSLPAGSGGYHTIHAYGDSRSGEAINLYQTVFIEDTQAEPETLMGLRQSSANDATFTTTGSNETTPTSDRIDTANQLGSGVTSTNETAHSARTKSVIPKNNSFSANWLLIGLSVFGVLLSVWTTFFINKKSKTLPGYKE